MSRRTLIAGVAAGAMALTVGGGLFAGTTDTFADPNHDLDNCGNDTGRVDACEAEYAPVNVAHRAGSGMAPEMTPAALEQVVGDNADRVEVDVQLSSDDEVVLMHDTDLKRTTDVEDVFPDRADEPTSAFTFEELQSLDAGSYFHEDFAGEQIATFAEVLDYVHEDGIGVSIELKSPELNPGLEQQVSDVIDSDDRWADLIDAGVVSFISFDQESLKRAVELQPEIPAAWLQTEVPDDDALAEVAEWTDIFGTNYRFLDAETLERIRSHGFEVNLWTLNGPEALQWAIDTEIEYLTTDFSNVLHSVLNDEDPFPEANGIEISDVDPDGDLDPEDGEHVVLTNVADEAIDVSGYFIRDAPHNLLHVGEDYVLEPGAELRIYSGPGTDTEDSYYNDLDEPILSEDGSSLALWSAQDRQLLDIFAY